MPYPTSTTTNPRVVALVKGMRTFDETAWASYGGRCSPPSQSRATSCAVIFEEEEEEDAAARAFVAAIEKVKKPSKIKKTPRSFAFHE